MKKVSLICGQFQKKCLAFRAKLRHYKVKDTAYKAKEEQDE